MISREMIGEEIVRFVENDRGINITVGTEIFKNRQVNSMFALRLLSFVEREFQVKLHDEDLCIENFQTPDALAKLVLMRATSSK